MPSVEFFGRIADEKLTDNILKTSPMPLLGPVGQSIVGTGEGKIQLLYKFLEAVTPNGKYPIRTQEIGDCVSQGTAGAVDILTASEIAAGQYEIWNGEAASEFIYGAARVTIGGGSIRGDGAYGAWGVKAIGLGTLVRKKYGNIDLSQYRGSLASQYGYYGPPKELFTYAKEHPVKSYSQVRTVEECRDAVANLFPVIICSNVGFTSKRDEQGFARASGVWEHCMLVVAVDDSSSRKGFCIMNSWGPNWISGPKKLDQPDGSFWCDYQTMQRILSQKDSWVISNFIGYPRQDLSWDVIDRAKERAKNFK